MYPYVMPHWFNGIELGTVRRQQAKVETMPVTGEPLLDFRSFMVRRVIMNEEDLLFPVSFGYSR
jgi:hypothetical protein